MSLNIIDLIKGQLGPALVSQAALQYGESESGISKAIGGLLPAVVGGLANNSDNPLILDAIMNSSSPDILNNLSGNSSNNSSIASVLTQIFGDKMNGLVNSVATYAEISNNSSNSLYIWLPAQLSAPSANTLQIIIWIKPGFQVFLMTRKGLFQLYCLQDFPSFS